MNNAHDSVVSMPFIAKQESLQSMQNRILKILHFKNRKYFISKFHKEANIFKLCDLFTMFCFVYRVRYNEHGLLEAF